MEIKEGKHLCSAGSFLKLWVEMFVVLILQ